MIGISTLGGWRADRDRVHNLAFWRRAEIAHLQRYLEAGGTTLRIRPARLSPARDPLEADSGSLSSRAISRVVKRPKWRVVADALAFLGDAETLSESDRRLARALLRREP